MNNIANYSLVAEKVFLSLNVADLVSARQVERKWRDIIDRPTFWLNKLKFHGIPKQTFLHWKQIIERTKNNPEAMRNIMIMLMKMVKSDIENGMPSFKSPLYKFLELDVSTKIIQSILQYYEGYQIDELLIERHCQEKLNGDDRNDSEFLYIELNPNLKYLIGKKSNRFALLTKYFNMPELNFCKFWINFEDPIAIDMLQNFDAVVSDFYLK